MLDERSMLSRPYPVLCCANPECGTVLDRDAYALTDSDERTTVVYCDACAQSAVSFHPGRFKPVLRRRWRLHRLVGS
jgi:hypothetical protein